MFVKQSLLVSRAPLNFLLKEVVYRPCLIQGLHVIKRHLCPVLSEETLSERTALQVKLLQRIKEVKSFSRKMKTLKLFNSMIIATKLLIKMRTGTEQSIKMESIVRGIVAIKIPTVAAHQTLRYLAIIRSFSRLLSNIRSSTQISK